MNRLLPASLTLFLISAAFAAENPPDSELATSTVTATRLGDAPFNQPYAFYSVDNERLDRQVGRTALDRFNYGPGVFIQRTAPNQASPFIRGLTGEQALLLLDGVRLSHAMMRPGPNQYASLIPDSSLNRIDAILGSSATVTGSDGLTGALDFRLAPAGRDVSRALSSWIETRADTGNGTTLALGLDGRHNDWAYSLEFSSSDFHDRAGGKDFRDHLAGSVESDEIPNTAYDQVATALRLAYFGLVDHVLELDAGHTYQSDAPRPGGYASNAGKEDRLYRFFDPQVLTYLHLRDHWQLDSDWIASLQTTLWWHRFHEEQFRASIRDPHTADERIRQRAYEDTLDAFGLDLQATSYLGSQAQHELTWGATLIHENTNNAYREVRTPTGSTDLSLLSPYKPESWSDSTSVPDGSSYQTVGLYAQDNWQLSQRFRLLSGLRFSRLRWSFGEVDGAAGTEDLSASLRGTYELSAEQRMFAAISRGFRAPNLKNLAGEVDRGSSGEAAAGSPDLKPESSLTYEAGWKWQRDRNYLAFTLFDTEISDLIQRDFSGTGETTNVERADLYGLETAWEIGRTFRGTGRLAVLGSASIVKGTRHIPVADGGTYEDNLSRASRLYGRLGLKLEPNHNWWALCQLRWHDAYDDLARHSSDSDAADVRLTMAGEPDGSVPGYATFDLLCGWQSDDGRRSVSLFIENLADTTYREPGSGADAVGRNFGLSAGVRF